MMQVIRVCDGDGGCWVGVGGRSCTARVCVCVCVIGASVSVTSFSERRVRGYAPLKVTVAGVMGGLGTCTVPQSLRPLNYLSSLP